MVRQRQAQGLCVERRLPQAHAGCVVDGVGNGGGSGQGDHAVHGQLPLLHDAVQRVAGRIAVNQVFTACVAAQCDGCLGAMLLRWTRPIVKGRRPRQQAARVGQQPRGLLFDLGMHGRGLRRLQVLAVVPRHHARNVDMPGLRLHRHLGHPGAPHHAGGAIVIHALHLCGGKARAMQQARARRGGIVGA
ncbi:hypothetical protein D3C73_857260 [compost metagenome]